MHVAHNPGWKPCATLHVQPVACSTLQSYTATTTWQLMRLVMLLRWYVVVDGRPDFKTIGWTTHL
jgi:hypothetical protein